MSITIVHLPDGVCTASGCRMAGLRCRARRRARRHDRGAGERGRGARIGPARRRWRRPAVGYEELAGAALASPASPELVALDRVGRTSPGTRAARRGAAATRPRPRPGRPEARRSRPWCSIRTSSAAGMTSTRGAGCRSRGARASRGSGARRGLAPKTRRRSGFEAAVTLYKGSAFSRVRESGGGAYLAAPVTSAITPVTCIAST